MNGLMYVLLVLVSCVARESTTNVVDVQKSEQSVIRWHHSMELRSTAPTADRIIILPDVGGGSK